MGGLFGAGILADIGKAAGPVVMMGTPNGGSEIAAA